MAIFTVVFEGLICHVGSSATSKQRSVLVWAPSADQKDNHIPLIRLPGGTEIPLQQHDSITFRNLPTGGADADPEFDRRVPALRRLLNPPNENMKSSVFSGLPDPAVAATVELPFGSLGAPWRHPRRIRFEFTDGDSESRCVPQQVCLTAVTASATVEVVITHRLPDGQATGIPTVWIVDANSMITIENLPEKPGGNHFGHFLMLTHARKMATVVNDETPCGWDALKAAPTEPKTGYAAIAASVSSRKMEVAEEQLEKQKTKGEKVTNEEIFANSNPECTNSGWP